MALIGDAVFQQDGLAGGVGESDEQGGVVRGASGPGGEAGGVFGDGGGGRGFSHPDGDIGEARAERHLAHGAFGKRFGREERGQGVVAFRRPVGTEEEHEDGGLGKG